MNACRHALQHHFRRRRCVPSRLLLMSSDSDPDFESMTDDQVLRWMLDMGVDNLQRLHDLMCRLFPQVCPAKARPPVLAHAPAFPPVPFLPGHMACGPCGPCVGCMGGPAAGPARKGDARGSGAGGGGVRLAPPPPKPMPTPPVIVVDPETSTGKAAGPPPTAKAMPASLCGGGDEAVVNPFPNVPTPPPPAPVFRDEHGNRIFPCQTTGCDKLCGRGEACFMHTHHHCAECRQQFFSSGYKGKNRSWGPYGRNPNPGS